ncbi:molybdenum cofactor guanylyltransferase MobA [Agaribacterium haliotis]|uniref:molybdenum cofactor guanylyltransferase MobA n=1 Tax=Agaribacterium haliotis TaxID=2013869 RepID=UPI000BB54BBE|nr:molybdenum cofactor guanylyltransferase MobA [Agaribacterium haliotis]
MTTRYSNTATAAVILAGGEARRMRGADKALCQLAGSSLLHRTQKRLSAQLDSVFLSVHNQRQSYPETGLPNILDPWQKRLGPLAGIYSAMCHVREYHPQLHHILSCPVDCPFVPLDLAEQLGKHANEHQSPVSYASFHGRDHYLCALWSVELCDKLELSLKSGQLAVGKFIRTYGGSGVEFNSQDAGAFTNINSPEDLNQAEAQLRQTDSKDSI